MLQMFAFLSEKVMEKSWNFFSEYCNNLISNCSLYIITDTCISLENCSGGGEMEAARARVRCAWAKFKEFSLILTVRGASYRIKGRIFIVLVSRVF